MTLRYHANDLLENQFKIRVDIKKFCKQNTAMLMSSFGVLLMSCSVKFHVVRSALQYSACRILYVYIFFFADQVFTDPTFFGIFVCGPLQSLVVNVCTLRYENYYSLLGLYRLN